VGRAATVCALALTLALVAAAVPAGAGPLVLPPRIAYNTGTARSGPFVWIANASGGGARMLGSGQDPLISPDGRYVAAGMSESGGKALGLYSTSDTDFRGFFNGEGTPAMPLAWSSDSRYLAVQLPATKQHPLGGGLAVLDTTKMRTRTLVPGGLLEGASFDPAPSGGDRLVYAMAKSLNQASPVNLYTVGPTGADPTQITHDNRSLEPRWGADGIIFVRETPRGADAYPIFQLWLRAGGRSTQLTHVKASKLVDGVVPLSVSDDGNRILAEFVGEDTSAAWTVQVSPRRVQQVTAGGGQFIQGGQISADGTRLLVYTDAFEEPYSHGTVESVAFGGGKPTWLARGADPTWDG
jgi:hypothetical protein